MRVGEYLITIEDAEGRTLAEVSRTGTTGHPLVGDEISLEREVYVVDRVRHEDDPDNRSAREYTVARVFVRRRRLRAGPSRRNLRRQLWRTGPRGSKPQPTDGAGLPRSSRSPPGRLFALASGPLSSSPPAGGGSRIHAIPGERTRLVSDGEPSES